jgi:outer membrane murein-binding lipoprotein Lpp
MFQPASQGDHTALASGPDRSDRLHKAAFAQATSGRGAAWKCCACGSGDDIVDPMRRGRTTMSDSDAFVREAVQAKVQSDIEARVYDKIKGDLRTWKFLGFGGSVIGGFILALVVTFHEPIFAFVVDSGGKQFREQIAKSLESAQKLQITTDVTIDRARAELVRLTDAASQSHDKVIEIAGKIEKKRQELDQESSKIDDLMSKQKDIEEAMALAQDRVAAALSRLADAGTEFDNISQRYDAIIAELKTNKVISTTANPTQVASTFASPRARSTVYFQFAGFARDDAVKISDAISKKGWQIPGQERTGGAVNTNQLRFNPKDAETAKLLKDDADAALQDLKLDIALTLQPNPVVKAGIPEIWIYKR